MTDERLNLYVLIGTGAVLGFAAWKAWDTVTGAASDALDAVNEAAQVAVDTVVTKPYDRYQEQVAKRAPGGDGGGKVFFDWMNSKI